MRICSEILTYINAFINNIRKYINRRSVSMGVKQNTYDAIVVGSGISGGWAAKELTEKGLKVLLLERGRNIEHIKGYETAMKHPWEFKHRGKLTEEQKEPILSKAGAVCIRSTMKVFG